MILSVIIPTKNRYKTLFKVVDTILNYNLNDDIEIVVQDNSDNNKEALLFLESHSSYGNLNYFYSADQLSVIDNSNRAVLNSNGDYICFIGDDDCILPNIIDVILWMKEMDFTVLKSYKPTYFWTGQQSNYLSKDNGGILKYRNATNIFKVFKTDESLRRTLDKGGVTMDYLPCLYHGIVKKSVLDKIYVSTGTYFPGPSPDMANGVALCKVVDKFVYINTPIVISGKSNASTSGAGVLHKHVSAIDEVKHLPSDTSALWSTKIPKYWTGPTIWAESCKKGLEAFKEVNLDNRFNFIYLYAYLFVFNFGDRNVILKDFNFKKGFEFYLYIFKLLIKRTFVFIRNRTKMGVKEISNVNDIGVAVSYIINESKRKNN